MLEINERMIEPITADEMTHRKMKLMIVMNAIIVKMIPKKIEPMATIPIWLGSNLNQEASLDPIKKLMTVQPQILMIANKISRMSPIGLRQMVMTRIIETKGTAKRVSNPTSQETKGSFCNLFVTRIVRSLKRKMMRIFEKRRNTFRMIWRMTKVRGLRSFSVPSGIWILLVRSFSLKLKVLISPLIMAPGSIVCAFAILLIEPVTIPDLRMVDSPPNKLMSPETLPAISRSLANRLMSPSTDAPSSITKVVLNPTMFPSIFSKVLNTYTSPERI